MPSMSQSCIIVVPNNGSSCQERVLFMTLGLGGCKQSSIELSMKRASTSETLQVKQQCVNRIGDSELLSKGRNLNSK